VSIEGSESVIARFDHSPLDPFTLLHEGNTVELVDRYLELQNRTGVLFTVKRIDPINQTIHLEPLPVTPKNFRVELTPQGNGSLENTTKRRFALRLWDGVGVLRLDETAETARGETREFNVKEESQDRWFPLGGDGVEIQFVFGDPTKPAQHQNYRPGDHWLIPARTAIEDILWEWTEAVGADGKTHVVPQHKKPHGIVGSYAPLATVEFSGGEFGKPNDKRRLLKRPELL
jgi:hypothetical protein